MPGTACLADQTARVRATGMPPAVVAYHQPCHWNAADPRPAPAQARSARLRKGTGLCCGMGGILKMSNPGLSMDLARRCFGGLCP